jgi:hypothetical protein
VAESYLLLLATALRHAAILLDSVVSQSPAHSNATSPCFDDAAPESTELGLSEGGRDGAGPATIAGRPRKNSVAARPTTLREVYSAVEESLCPFYTSAIVRDYALPFSFGMQVSGWVTRMDGIGPCRAGHPRPHRDAHGVGTGWATCHRYRVRGRAPHRVVRCQRIVGSESTCVTHNHPVAGVLCESSEPPTSGGYECTCIHPVLEHWGGPCPVVAGAIDPHVPC